MDVTTRREIGKSRVEVTPPGFGGGRTILGYLAGFRIESSAPFPNQSFVACRFSTMLKK